MADIVRGEYTLIDLSLGNCECPGDPHGKYDPATKQGGDSCKYKSRLMYGAWRKINSAQPEMKQPILFAEAIVSWNLVDADGPIAIDIESLDQLSVRQIAVLTGTLDNPTYTLGSYALELPKEVRRMLGIPDSPPPMNDASSVSGPEGSSS